MIDCPNCGHWNMKMFGVSERGHYKYACTKCYKQIEVPPELHRSWKESIDKAAESLKEEIDKMIIQKVIKESKTRYGWWAKYGHWVHTTFSKAMDHFIRGGKIKFGRW